MITVEYGCSEWQDQDQFSTIIEAQNYYDEITNNPLILGLYTMNFALLKNENDTIIDSWNR